MRAIKDAAAQTVSPEKVAAAAFGLDNSAVAMDAFSNIGARMGWGSPSIAEGAEYNMIRWSNDYWLMVTLYRNHWLARRIVECGPKDMVRAWPNLISSLSQEDIKILDRRIQRTLTRTRIRKGLTWGELFGGGGSLMVIKGHEDILEEPLELDDIKPGDYQGLITFDRWSGITPGNEFGNDITRPMDFGLPSFYNVRAMNGDGFKVHSSRILRWEGLGVPQPEFQASNYWGISRLETTFEQIRKGDNASWSILNLLFRAQILSMKEPELAQMLSGATVTNGGLTRYHQRMQAMNESLSNQSMLVVGKDGGIENTTYSFSGVGDVYQQFQLDTAGAAESTVSRLFGRTISGLSSTNEGDEKVYEERIAVDQDEKLEPQLQKLYPVMMMSEFGEVPDDFDLDFPSIRVLTETEKSLMAKDGGATVSEAYGNDGLTKKQYLRELSTLSRTTGVFTSITPEDIAAAPNKYLSELGGGDIPPGGEDETLSMNGDEDEGNAGGEGEDE
jgi:phage-related protein (TIGR01555 family)